MLKNNAPEIGKTIKSPAGDVFAGPLIGGPRFDLTDVVAPEVLAQLTFSDKQFIYTELLLDILRMIRPMEYKLYFIPGMKLVAPGLVFNEPRWINSPGDYAKGISLSTPDGVQQGTEMTPEQIGYLMSILRKTIASPVLLTPEGPLEGYADILDYITTNIG